MQRLSLSIQRETLQQTYSDIRFHLFQYASKEFNFRHLILLKIRVHYFKDGKNMKDDCAVL